MKHIIVKGLGVSPGIAKGKITIIKHKEDFKNFVAGNILVVPLTDPTMVLLISKAAGIICDYGGLMSHPAIVSREMGIPCIVSAKSLTGKRSTEVLKDEMVIEMSGKSGRVVVLQ